MGGAPPPPTLLGWIGPTDALLCLQSGDSGQERSKKKRRGDRYSVQTSLIVAALKKMLPIGLNMCSPADQELINLAKIRYSLVVHTHTHTYTHTHMHTHRYKVPGIHRLVESIRS